MKFKLLYTAKRDDFELADSPGWFFRIGHFLEELVFVSTWFTLKVWGIGHFWEESARGPFSIRRISENDKIGNFSCLRGSYSESNERSISLTDLDDDVS